MISSPTLHFPDGLVGCPEWRHFRLEQSPEAAPIVVLRSDDEPGLSLLAADPRLWSPHYRFDVSPEDLAALGASSPGDLAVLSILTLEPEPLCLAANLLGPLVIHPVTGAGRQIVQSHRGYSARQPLTGPLSLISFPDGLVGCPDWRDFALCRTGDADPVQWLVWRNLPALSLPVVDPWQIDPAYAPRLAEADRAALGAAGDSDLAWLAILSVHPESGDVTANLLGPLAVNRHTGAARQVILSQSGYSAVHPVLSGLSLPPAEARRRTDSEADRVGAMSGGETPPLRGLRRTDSEADRVGAYTTA